MASPGKRGYLSWLLLAGALNPAVGFAQNAPPAAPLEQGGLCESINLEKRKVRNVTLVTPFDWLHLRFVRELEASLLKTLKIQPGAAYRVSDANAATDQLTGDDLSPLAKLSPPANFGLPFSGSVVRLRAFNCITDAGTDVVDLEFYFIPARIPSFWGHSFESRSEDATDAARPAGVAPRKYWVTPTVGYSQAARVFGGISARFEVPSKREVPSSGAVPSKGGPSAYTFSLDGWASTQARFLNASISGGYGSSHPFLKRASYTGGMSYRDEPAGTNRFQASQGYLEWKAASGPLGSASLILRYGTSLEGGNRRAYTTAAEQGITTNTSFFGLKGFGGTTLRTRSQTFAASYGILAGRTGNGGTFDFRKHLVDVAHSWTWVHNHYPLEFDSRISAGRIENLCGRQPTCGVPLAERFFGGNVERNLLTDSSWVIRSQPYIRGLPLNGFNTAGAGASLGGDRFWAVNLTVAAGVARKTLIPEDLLSQQGFLQRIDSTVVTATSLLASAYASVDTTSAKDPGIMKARLLLPDIRTEMGKFQPAWDLLALTMPAVLADEFAECDEDNIPQVPLDIDDVEHDKKSIMLLSNGSGSLAKTVKCLRRFSQSPGDPLDVSAGRLDALRKQIVAAVEATDTYKRADAQARKDMAVAGRTIHTLFHEVNIASFSPVFAFDAAALGPALPGTPARRYAIGGGGRLTVLSTIRLTAGYAANLQRQRGEGSGALFFSMEFLDIFGR